MRAHRPMGMFSRSFATIRRQRTSFALASSVWGVGRVGWGRGGTHTDQPTVRSANRSHASPIHSPTNPTTIHPSLIQHRTGPTHPHSTHAPLRRGGAAPAYVHTHITCPTTPPPHTHTRICRYRSIRTHHLDGAGQPQRREVFGHARRRLDGRPALHRERPHVLEVQHAGAVYLCMAWRGYVRVD